MKMNVSDNWEKDLVDRVRQFKPTHYCSNVSNQTRGVLLRSVTLCIPLTFAFELLCPDM